MAIYGFDLKTVSRLRGETVVKTAAYIVRGKIRDEYENKIHDRTQFKDLVHSEVLLPENAPREFYDLQTLVREMERAEKRYDGLLASSSIIFNKKL